MASHYGVYLWLAYSITLGILLINLLIPALRYYKVLRNKKRLLQIKKS